MGQFSVTIPTAAGSVLSDIQQQASPAGQRVSDYTGAAALLNSLPSADWLLADRGYDADWFRDALKDKGIKPCIPGRKSRGKPVKYDKRRYKRVSTQRNLLRLSR
jgi:IS5 family transposase